MKHGSLFSGIGGFDLAAEWMGWENIFHCEINSFCRKVLKKHFPNSICYADIRKTDFTKWNGKIDIISGGFPCQPFSAAGERKGTEDNRHLWPEMLKAIASIQPSWVVGENVPGIINWSNGLVFEQVQTDLEDAGFEVFPPCILPACGKNASHRRDRVWIIAYSDKNKCSRTSRQDERKGNIERVQEWDEMELIDKSDSLGVISNTNSIGQQRRKQRKQETQSQRYDSENSVAKKLRYSGFEDVLPTPRIFGADDGIPNGVDRVKSLGNAIVPQVVYEIFKTIEAFNFKK